MLKLKNGDNLTAAKPEFSAILGIVKRRVIYAATIY
jgi:hypothetical protein